VPYSARLAEHPLSIWQAIARALVPSAAAATVVVASGFTLVLFGGREALGELGYTLVTLPLVYYGCACITGFIVGMSRPIAVRGKLGASAVGAVCGAICLPLSVLPRSSSVTAWVGMLPLWLVAGVVCGGLVGYEIASLSLQKAETEALDDS